MRALSSSRKRGNDYCQYSLVTPFDHFRFSKKHRLSGFMDQRASDCFRSGASRIIRYPDSKPGFRREVHAPISSNRFGFSCKGESSAGFNEISDDKMKFLLGRYKSTKNLAMKSMRYITEDEAAVSLRLGNEKEDIEIDGDDENQVVVSDDSSVEEEIVKKKLHSLNSSVVTDLSNEHAKVNVVEKMMNLMQLEHEIDIVVPAHKKLYDSSLRRNGKLHRLKVEIERAEMQRRMQLLLRPYKHTGEAMRGVAEECFAPLSVEEEADVTSALSSKSNRGKVLVSHETSNIDITGEKLQCLRPGEWLNDEVINLYVELLKEREKREPQKFLKCHFFNTFFYKKLIAGKGGYNFQSVRRWTTLKKLGYSLLDCDKIFVPIHKINHWCLAVINKKGGKFQYLDSLKGRDNKVMKVLASYYVDEVKEKTGEDIDVSSWEAEFVEDLPEQENGYDCGMFMLKYADFYSRDIGLYFSQKNMPYFRRRTAKEILRLRAD